MESRLPERREMSRPVSVEVGQMSASEARRAPPPACVVAVAPLEGPWLGDVLPEALVRQTTDAAGERYGFGMLLDHAALHEHLLTALRPEDLLMLPFEALAETPEGFTETILRRLRTPPERIESLRREAGTGRVNARSDEGRWLLRPRALRPGRKRPLEMPLWTSPVRRHGIRLTPELSQRVLATYEAGNRTLAEATGLDLANHGYFTRA